MKLHLTIDQQPLFLELEAALALFGSTRVIQFVQGKWSPFVLCESAEPVQGIPAPEGSNLVKLDPSELNNLFDHQDRFVKLVTDPLTDIVAYCSSPFSTSKALLPSQARKSAAK